VRRLIKVVIGLVVFCVALALGAAAAVAFLLGLVVVLVSGALDGRWCVAAGLICLACCPAILLFNKTTWLQQSPLVNYYVIQVFGSSFDADAIVETLALWAYYLLGIGVLTQIVRHYRTSA